MLNKPSNGSGNFIGYPWSFCWLPIFFGINTGLRVSALIKLNVGDIYGKPYADLLEKKTKKKRRLHLIAIQGDIVEYCIRKQPDNFLFPSKKTDSPISTTQAYRILVAAGEWIGRRDIGTHTMRKTFGYHYYKRTKDVYTLMEIFGHSSPNISKRYIGRDP